MTVSQQQGSGGAQKKDMQEGSQEPITARLFAMCCGYNFCHWTSSILYFVLFVFTKLLLLAVFVSMDIEFLMALVCMSHISDVK